ncbi:MAG: DUF3410 domain-containing protein, partial [Phycisphaerae bacterium]
FSRQQVIKAAVDEIYKIAEDGRNLRSILNLPMGKRCATFDRLRKEYPIRREFQNTTIAIVDEANGIGDKLKGIGFKVKDII